MFVSAPDIASCRAGAQTQATRDEVLAAINRIRALHRLPPVAYAGADEQQATEAAPMMAAINALNHNPATTWACHCGKLAKCRAVDDFPIRVSVTAGGAALAISKINFATDGYGLTSNIQFAVAGLQQNVSYRVTIENVVIAGQPMRYAYDFRIMPRIMGSRGSAGHAVSRKAVCRTPPATP